MHEPLINEDSSSEDDDSDAFKYDSAAIKNLLDKYESRAQREINYLLGTTYNLNGLFIKIGLSPVRAFGVAVAISLQNNQISFGYHEWCLFIDLLQQKYDTFFKLSSPPPAEDSAPIITKCGGYTQITQMSDKKGKILYITRLGVDGQHRIDYPLTKDNVRDILEVNALLLCHRTLMLEQLNFNKYYNDLIEDIKIDIRDKNLDGLDVLNVYCDGSDHSMQSLALREYIYLYKENVINDFK